MRLRLIALINSEQILRFNVSSRYVHFSAGEKKSHFATA